MTPTTPADNLRRALETIRDLPDDEVENGPEIADAELDAIDHLEALTTPADASPAAVEIVAWRVGYTLMGLASTKWHYEETVRADLGEGYVARPLVDKALLDTSRAETDAANARAERAEREVAFLTEQEAGWLQVAADSTRRWQTAESKLADTAAERTCELPVLRRL